MSKSSTHVYSERTSIEVKNPRHLVSNYVTVKIDDEEHCLPETVAKELQEKLEREVVEVTYQYETMQAENDRLQQRIEELEELLNTLGYREAV